MAHRSFSRPRSRQNSDGSPRNSFMSTIRKPSLSRDRGRATGYTPGGLVEVVHNPPEAAVDVYFVHGIGEKWTDTWRGEGKAEPWTWIEHLLPKDLSRTRVCAFGSDLLERRNSLDQISQKIAEGLVAMQVIGRPIIFVAHSLGCLIVESLIVQVSRQHKFFVKGIIFLAPTHFGPNVEAWKSFREQIAKFMGRNQRQRIRSPLDEPEFNNYVSLNLSFDRWLEENLNINPTAAGSQLFSFFENVPLYRIGLLVAKRDSTLKINTSNITDLASDHFNIVRFGSRSSPGYRRVIQRLRFLVDGQLGGAAKHRDSVASPRNSQEVPTIRKPQPYSDGREVFLNSKSVIKSAKMALALEDLGFDENADAAYQRAIDEYRGQADHDIESVLYLQERRAGLFRARGEYDQAIQLNEMVLEKRRSLFRLYAPATIACAGRLALIMRCKDDIQMAFLLLRQVMECNEIDPFEEVYTIRIVSIMARLYMDYGVYDIAELLCRDVVVAAIKRLGDDHPYTLMRKVYWAAALSAREQPVTAIQIARQALDGLERSQGKVHPDALLAARELGNCYRKLGDYSKATQWLEYAAGEQKRRSELNRSRTLTTLSDLASTYALQSHNAESLSLLQRIKNDQLKFLGPEHRYNRWITSAIKCLEELKSSNRDSKDSKASPIPAQKAGSTFYEQFAGPRKYELEFTVTSEDLFWMDEQPTSLIGAILRAESWESFQSIISKAYEPVDLGQALRIAAYDGKIVSTHWLLDHGVDINSRGSFYGTALQAASFSGISAVVRLLLENGADVNLQGGICGSPLRAAIIKNNTDIVSMLLDWHDETSLAVPELVKTLQIAISLSRTNIACLLIEKAATLSTVHDPIYGTVLQEACAMGNVDIVQTLLKNGADPTSTGGLFGSPSKAALENGHMVVLKKLMEHSIEAISEDIFYSDKFWEMAGDDDDFIDFYPALHTLPSPTDVAQLSGNRSGGNQLFPQRRRTSFWKPVLKYFSRARRSPSGTRDSHRPLTTTGEGALQVADSARNTYSAAITGGTDRIGPNRADTGVSVDRPFLEQPPVAQFDAISQSYEPNSHMHPTSTDTTKLRKLQDASVHALSPIKEIKTASTSPPGSGSQISRTTSSYSGHQRLHLHIPRSPTL